MTKLLIRRPGLRSRLLLNAILAGAVLILLPGAAAAQRGASGPPEHAAVEPINDGPNPYETIRDWGSLPDGRSWGSVSAAEVGQNPTASGRGHTVIKFSPEGEVLLTLGTPGEAGDPPTHFTQPADVQIAPDGSIFVAESHGAQFQDEAGPRSIGRISKFTPDGTFIKSWGSWGYRDGQFRGPHAFAMDSQGRLFISDRGNRRIQIFDQEGTHLDTWYQFSRNSGIFIDANDVLYAIDSESDDNYNPGWKKGLRVGSARTGEILYFIPAHESARPSGMGGVGSIGEGVTADAAGNIIAGEVGPIQGLTKFERR